MRICTTCMCVYQSANIFSRRVRHTESSMCHIIATYTKTVEFVVFPADATSMLVTCFMSGAHEMNKSIST